MRDCNEMHKTNFQHKKHAEKPNTHSPVGHALHQHHKPRHEQLQRQHHSAKHHLAHHCVLHLHAQRVAQTQVAVEGEQREQGKVQEGA